MLIHYNNPPASFLDAYFGDAINNNLGDDLQEAHEQARRDPDVTPPPATPLTSGIYLDEKVDGIPRVQITLADETVWITTFDPSGYPASTYQVDPLDVARAFAPFSISSGMLPHNVLFWDSTGDLTRIAVWIRPGKRTILFRTGGDKVLKLHIPLPGFVFMGQGANYYLFAAKRRPTTPDDTLYLAPLPNVKSNGKICAGSVRFPLAGNESMQKAIRLLWESEFNHDLGNGKTTSDLNMLQFLQSIDGTPKFDQRFLRFTDYTMHDLISGRVAKGQL